jgi:hypothetical protein
MNQAEKAKTLEVKKKAEYTLLGTSNDTKKSFIHDQEVSGVKDKEMIRKKDAM